jgi:hypothetical protein
VAYDPCLTVADTAAPAHATHHTHHLVHRIVGRARHRVHHTQVASAPAAPVPSDACGKHLPSKSLAKLPVAAAPKAAVVGAASLLGAGVASTVGTHSFTPPVPPSGPGLPPPVITVPPVVTPTPPPVSVPEPSSIVLFLVAVTVAMIVRHRAQRNAI